VTGDITNIVIRGRNAKIVLHPAASLTIGSDVDINLKDADSFLYVNSTAWGLYKLMSGTISYSDFRLPRGGDLRFTDADGKLIPHEIDTWDEGGTSCVWVKVPTLAAGTRIVALCDCVQPDTPSAESVWDGVGTGILPVAVAPFGEMAKIFKTFGRISVFHRFGFADGHGRVSPCAIDKLSLQLFWLFSLQRRFGEKERCAQNFRSREFRLAGKVGV